jgi:sugar phosphate isomerase/epimerase
MSADLLGSFWTLAVGAYPWTGPEYCPHDFRLRVETAARAGFTGLGFWGRDLEQVLKTYSFKDMKRILDDNGIVDIEVEWLLDWFRTDERRVASDQTRTLLLNAAEALRARHIKVADLGNDSVTLPEMTEHFAVLCAEAAARGTRVVFEYLPPPLSSLRTVDQVLELTRGSGAANGGIMLDLWHMVRSGTSNEDLAAKLRPSDILGVEINDGLLATPADLSDATINHRLLVGSGEFDVRGFVRTMRKVGYTGHVGVEILNAEIREWTLERAAKAAFDTSVPVMA